MELERLKQRLEFIGVSLAINLNINLTAMNCSFIMNKENVVTKQFSNEKEMNLELIKLIEFLLNEVEETSKETKTEELKISWGLAKKELIDKDYIKFENNKITYIV